MAMTQLRVIDTFQVTGRGFIISADVERGDVRIGQRVQWHTPDGSVRTGFVRSVEERYGMGDKRIGPVGLRIASTNADDFAPGTVMWHA